MHGDYPTVEKSRLRASDCQIVLPNTLRSFAAKILLNIALVVCALTASTMTVEAQDFNSDKPDGKICGTVSLKTDHRAMSQVALKLKSHAAVIFRSVLTDFAGRFEVRGLPRGTYDIVVDEPGYEPAQTSAQTDGASSQLVLYVKSSSVPQTPRDSYSVSARELRIPGKARREFEKGLERLLKQDPAGSVSHFTKAAQVFPDYYEAYYHVGVAETSLGRRDEAMQAFQKAIDLRGGRHASPDFSFRYPLYLEVKPAEAVTIIPMRLEADESSAVRYLILGLARLHLDPVDQAEKSAHEALLRNPNFAQAYLVLADVYARRHEYRAHL